MPSGLWPISCLAIYIAICMYRRIRVYVSQTGIIILFWSFITQREIVIDFVSLEKGKFRDNRVCPFSKLNNTYVHIIYIL